MALTPKQQAFIREYLVDMNATRAARTAGYSEKTAEQQGYQLLQLPLVKEALQKAMDARAERTELTADFVLNGIRELVDRCLQAQAVLNDEGEPVGEYRFEAATALRGYELLGKHLGLFPNKVDVQVKDELTAIIESARRRATSQTARPN